MRLLNVSIGRVRTVQIAGAEVRTAYVKAPIAAPWTITPDGVAGDERAVHPDKLYAFARTGYAHWAAHLGVDRTAWPDGFFGENLTLDQLDEEQLRIGDVFAIGDTVRVMVVGARNPCIKLAWHLGQPRSFQRVFALSRRTGVYLAVVAPGTVAAGDEVRRIAHDPSMPSIADVADFINSHHAVPLEPLRRLLAFDGLSQTNRLLLSSKLEAAERAAAVERGLWPGWRRFVIDRVVAETPQIRSVHLRAADGERLCQPRPGQFVTVRMEDAEVGTVTRPWSLSAHGDAMDEYRLTVRRQSGPGSAWIHRAEPGASVELRAPAGQFTLDTGCFRPVVLVGAGIGITPLLAMLQAHVARRQAPLVHLIYGVRTPADLAFRDEIEAIRTAHPDVRVTYVFSRADVPGHPTGRITTSLVIDTLTDLHVVLEGGRRIDLPWFESDIYLCGPDEFCTSLRDGFIAAGANPDHLFFEHFTTAPATDAACESEVEIRFARSKVTATWRPDDDLTLLELAEREGIEIAQDCRAGTCLSCATRIEDGSTTSMLDAGRTLLCVARPVSARVVLDA